MPLISIFLITKPLLTKSSLKNSNLNEVIFLLKLKSKYKVIKNIIKNYKICFIENIFCKNLFDFIIKVI